MNTSTEDEHAHCTATFDLNGKTALVTGGSSGLGLQIAEALGEQGARVMLSARKVDELEEILAADGGVSAV